MHTSEGFFDIWNNIGIPVGVCDYHNNVITDSE